MSRPRLIALLLALITLAVYLPAGRFAFVNLDDNDYITQNPYVTNGLTGTDIAWAFTTFHASNWHPLTWLSHMTDCELFKLNAGAHHFVNVLYHAANAALLFTLLWRLTSRLWPAAGVAMLFAWHPAHVESVAWVAERKDVLSTFFALLALLAYARSAADGGRRTADAARVTRLDSRYYWLAVLFFTLGLLAKPMLVTLPCLMLVLDWWPLKRVVGGRWQAADWLRLGREKISFFLLSVGSCVITFIAQSKGEAVVSLTRIPLHFRLENSLAAAAGYVQMLLWPSGLCAYYPMHGQISAVKVTGAAGMLVAVTLAGWYWRRTKPYLLAGWLWFLGTLVPVIGLVQVGGQAMADRYTYIPSMGFFLALVFLAADAAAQWRVPKGVVTALMVLAGTACILATEKQLPSWRDGETLYLRAVAVNPVNDIALIEGGMTLADEGRNAEALALYQQAEQIAPERAVIHNNLGNLLDTLGRPAEALAEYRLAVAREPGNARLHNALGAELANLGQFDEALKELALAETIDPGLGGPHFETAKIYFKLGRDADGVGEFKAALRREPGSYQFLATTAHYLAADEDAAVRDGGSALPLALKANALSGESQPAVFDILGMAFAANGDFTNAITCAQNALDLAAAMKLEKTGAIRQRLELYQHDLPWRESFRATNAPTDSRRSPTK